MKLSMWSPSPRPSSITRSGARIQTWGSCRAEGDVYLRGVIARVYTVLCLWLTAWDPVCSGFVFVVVWGRFVVGRDRTSFLFCSFETGSRVTQAGLKLAA